MRTLVIASLAIAFGGCGRIGFDGVGGVAGDDGIDPNGAWPTLEGKWTWMSGSNVVNALGVYGTLNVGDPANSPGARDNGGMWVDGDALWLFSGIGFGDATIGPINDLWSFDVTAAEWTWRGGPMQPNGLGAYGTRGVADPTNLPPPRNDPVSWRAADGSMWLAGGTKDTQSDSYRNDMWRYVPGANLWTWVSGDTAADDVPVRGDKGTQVATNDPGARGGAQVWASRDGVYLFGGNGRVVENGPYGGFADVWRFDIAGAQWTWLAGPVELDRAAQRGIKGVPDASNHPEPYGLCSFGSAATGTLGFVDNYADVWEFDVATATWTWVAGDGVGALPSYTAPREFAPSNTPGQRSNSDCWTDRRGNLWLFGGQGNGVGGVFGMHSDLWIYDPTLRQWAFITGTTDLDGGGTYGTKGVPASTNAPGARLNGAVWFTSDGALWMFGGEGHDRVNDVGEMGDLWRFAAD